MNRQAMRCEWLRRSTSDGASLDLIRHIQRCYGYGQRMDDKDVRYYHDLQHRAAIYGVSDAQKIFFP